VTRLLESEHLWRELRGLARRSSARRLIAVPFVGKGASGLLPLRRDDALLCALTLANCRAGAVCPAELRKLRRRGVRLYQQPNLHAKVFLFGRSAIVGSPNLSVYSKDNLDEAALLVSDTRCVRDVRLWFQERLTEPVSPGWLDKCEKAYRPPRVIGLRGQRLGNQNRFGGRKVWIVGVKETDFPKDEDAAYRAGEAAARTRLSRPRRMDIEPIRWAHADGLSERVEAGDLMIQVFDYADARGRRVLPVGKVLGVKRLRSKRGGLAHYVYLELPKEYRTLAWAGFKRECRSFGLRLRRNVYQREVHDRLATRRLLDLTAAERLAKK
jgi:hypothetical protein